MSGWTSITSKFNRWLSDNPNVKSSFLNPSLWSFLVGGLGAVYFYTPAPYLAVFYALVVMLSVLPGTSTSYKIAGSFTGIGLILFDLAARVSVEIFRGWSGLALVFLFAIAFIMVIFRSFFVANQRWQIRQLSEHLFPISSQIDGADVWRVRVVYGILSFGISAATLVTFANWIEFAYLDFYPIHEFILFFLVQIGAVFFQLQLYHLTRRGYWRWAVWGFNLLALVAIFGGATSIQGINDSLGIFVIPVMLSTVLLSWRSAVFYGILVYCVYAWYVPPGHGEFNYFNLVVVALVGILSHFLTLRLRSSLKKQQQANQEQILAFKQLQVVNRKMELIILGVSHEIRTPLTVLSGNVAILKAMINDETLLPLLKSMESDGLKRLQKLAIEMNNVVQDHNEGLDMQYQSVNLLLVIKRILHDERSKCQTITLQIKEDTIFDADQNALTQILRAIIENACLHGGGQVVISARLEGERVAISVSDKGPGIPDQELPYVFTPFMRGDQTIGREGRGMGLTMAKLLIEAHGGTIWIESEVNKGSCVFVRLPIKQSQGD